MGRRGQSTRLELDRHALQTYIEAGPSTPPWQSSEGTQAPQPEDEPAPAGNGHSAAPQVKVELVEAKSPAPTPAPVAGNDKVKVFISHGKNAGVVDQIQTMLSLAGFECEIAEKEETAAIPVPEKVFTAMRRCHAGIIAVTVEEGKKDIGGNYAVNDNVLIEIGAAFVLYDKRVVLLWDKRIPVPSNLQGLYRCEFEGGELSWTAGMKLMKAIQGFKPPTQVPATT
jgi:predicted nucleotide-binding protein